MHCQIRRNRRARRNGNGDGNHTDSEDTEPEEERKDEMDNFQDLQLGSITPLVRRGVDFLPDLLSPPYLPAGYGPSFRTLTLDTAPLTHASHHQDKLETCRPIWPIYAYGVYRREALSICQPVFISTFGKGVLTLAYTIIPEIASKFDPKPADVTKAWLRVYRA